MASGLAPNSAGFGPRSIHVRFTPLKLGPHTFRAGREVQDELGVDVLGGACAALALNREAALGRAERAANHGTKQKESVDAQAQHPSR
jgi:hypothetical protein